MGYWFALVVRCLVMAAILACGLLLFETYRELFHEVTPRQEQPDVRTPDPVERFRAELIRPGAWSFGETNWALQSHILPENKFNEHYTRSLPPAAPPGPLTSLERDALHWLRSAGEIEKREIDTGSVYELKKPGFRLRALTQGKKESQRIGLIRIAWPADPENWTLLEIQPVGQANQVREEHLLTVPDQTSLARRWDEQGHVVAEVVRPGESFDAWLDALKRDHWTTRPVVQLEQGGSSLLLQREERVILVWRFPALGGPFHDCLMLLADPLEQRREGRAP